MTDLCDSPDDFVTRNAWKNRVEPFIFDLMDVGETNAAEQYVDLHFAWTNVFAFKFKNFEAAEVRSSIDARLTGSERFGQPSYGSISICLTARRLTTAA